MLPFLCQKRICCSEKQTRFVDMLLVAALRMREAVGNCRNGDWRYELPQQVCAGRSKDIKRNGNQRIGVEQGMRRSTAQRWANYSNGLFDGLPPRPHRVGQPTNIAQADGRSSTIDSDVNRKRQVADEPTHGADAAELNLKRRRRADAGITTRKCRHKARKAAGS